NTHSFEPADSRTRGIGACRAGWIVIVSIDDFAIVDDESPGAIGGRFSINEGHCTCDAKPAGSPNELRACRERSLQMPPHSRRIPSFPAIAGVEISFAEEAV